MALDGPGRGGGEDARRTLQASALLFLVGSALLAPAAGAAGGPTVACAPLPPTDLRLARDEGTGTVRLLWDPPLQAGHLSGVRFYRVYRLDLGAVANGFRVIGDVDAQRGEFLDTLARSGRDYGYFVTAVGACGESAPSLPVFTMVSDCYPVRLKPLADEVTDWIEVYPDCAVDAQGVS